MKKEDKQILKEFRNKEARMHTPSFIEEYPNAMPNELCDKLVKLADEQISVNPDLQRHNPLESSNISYRKDWFLFTQTFEDIGKPVNVILNNYLQQYIDTYMGAFYSGRYFSHYQKLQVTPPGGGFHNWHNEHSTTHSMERIMAWMFYLNDINYGGETEFLHQRVRLTPTKGTLVLFPAAFTHCHRGNPPLNETKYILTGWYHIAIDPDNY